MATVRTIESGIKSMKEAAKKFLEKIGFEKNYSVIGAFTTQKMRENLEKDIGWQFQE